MIYLITGGARSGKSRYAEDLAAKQGENICYIATAIAFDEAMQARVAKHRAQRPAQWVTHEGYRDLAKFITDNHGRYKVYLLDCVTLLITNLMFDLHDDYDALDEAQIDMAERAITEQLTALIKALKQTDSTMIFVTNELGSGVVPENKLARIFRDIAGRVNQMLASHADQVVLTVCGQALVVKDLT